MLHAGSDIANGFLRALMEAALLCLIGSLPSMRALLFDLRRLRSRGRMRIKGMNTSTAGSARRAPDGCFAFSSMLIAFAAILAAEVGVNGGAVKRRGEPLKPQEARSLSVGRINNAEISMHP